MADKKISQLTELTSANAATDFLPVVDTSAVETKKITLANLPLSDAAKDSAYPYTTDFQSGTEQTRNLTTIDSSSGFSYTGQPSSIYIGSNVTSIGNDAFAVSSSLTSITIPNSVTSIGSFAFQYCSSLTSATIGNSVTSIGTQAFYLCSSLTSATIGNSVTSIGSQAFYYCTSLTSINIPDSVTSIGVSAFNATGLTSVIIPNSVTSIGSQAFYYCTSATTINCLATTAPTIGSNPFNGVATSDIHVPVGATGYGTTYGGLTVVFDL